MLLVKSLDAGADGAVSGTANVIPGLFKRFLSDKKMQEIMKTKKEIENLSPNYIEGIKKKLVQMDLIKSSELF